MYNKHTQKVQGVHCDTNCMQVLQAEEGVLAVQGVLEVQGVLCDVLRAGTTI